MVSVIIPIYNVEKYLHECVDSVLSQTYKDIEIILVDDGSPDRCGEICDEYAAADSRVRVIHKQNGGLSDARNAGLDAAKGEYIYFLDSDDYIKENAIEKLVNRIKTENADIVFFDAENFAEDFEYPDYTENFSRAHKYRTSRGTLMLGALTRKNEYFPLVQLMFFRKAFFEHSGLRFYNGIIHEDELFTPIAFVRADLAAQLNEKLYFRRLRGNSIMSGMYSAKSVECSAVVIRELEKELEKYPGHSHERAALQYCMESKSVNFLLNYSKLDKADKKRLRPLYDEAKKIISEKRYFGNRGIWRLICHPFLYPLYLDKIKPIRNKITGRIK